MRYHQFTRSSIPRPWNPIRARYKGHQVMPRQALAKHDLPRVIHPHRVKHVLCEIDPEDGHLLLHGTHLLWLNGFPNLLELIVAHCRRSAQGRVHFITTRHSCRGGCSPYDSFIRDTSPVYPGASSVATQAPTLPARRVACAISWSSLRTMSSGIGGGGRTTGMLPNGSP